jgi:hypothetical protein
MASKINVLVDIGNSNISWKIGDCYSRVDIKGFQVSAIPQHQISTIACPHQYVAYCAQYQE